MQPVGQRELRVRHRERRASCAACRGRAGGGLRRRRLATIASGDRKEANSADVQAGSCGTSEVPIVYQADVLVPRARRTRRRTGSRRRSGGSRGAGRELIDLTPTESDCRRASPIPRRCSPRSPIRRPRATSRTRSAPGRPGRDRAATTSGAASRSLRSGRADREHQRSVLRLIQAAVRSVRRFGDGAGARAIRCSII